MARPLGRRSAARCCRGGSPSEVRGEIETAKSLASIGEVVEAAGVEPASGKVHRKENYMLSPLDCLDWLLGADTLKPAQPD